MEFVVSKARLARLILMALALVAASSFCTTLPELTPRVVGWLGVCLFGGALVTLVVRWWRRGIAVEIHPGDIRDYRNGIVVPWSEVRGVWITEVANNRFLSLDVEAPERFVTTTGWRRHYSDAASRLNRSAGFAPINIPFHELSPGIDEAWAYLQSLDLSHLPVNPELRVAA